jgi:hypothetical protein
VISGARLELEELILRRARADKATGGDLAAQINLSMKMLDTAIAELEDGKHAIVLRLRAKFVSATNPDALNIEMQHVVLCNLVDSIKPNPTPQVLYALARRALISLPGNVHCEHLRQMLNAFVSVGVVPGPDVTEWFPNACKQLHENLPDSPPNVTVSS